MNLVDYINEHGINTIVKRISVLYPHMVERLQHPVITNAVITDMQQVIDVIKAKWSVFNIKDVRIEGQSVCFKIYGGPCYIPEKFKKFRVIDWSPVETEKYNFSRIIEEEYAEENSMELVDFLGKGIEADIV